MRSQVTEAASAEPKYPFVTSEGAILCQTPSAIREAIAAVAASDEGWFEKTGCVRTQGELRVVLIEAPLDRSSVTGSFIPTREHLGEDGSIRTMTRPMAQTCSSTLGKS
jgi:hypothetical protein